MAPPRRSTRALLALGIGLGLIGLVAFPLRNPDQVGLATAVYTEAAEALLAGENLYTVSPPGLPGYRFVYPPVVAIAFLPYGLLGDATLAFAVQTAINVVVALALTRVIVELLDFTRVDLARLDHLLIGAYCLLGTQTTVTLVNGQVNLVLGLLVGLGLLYIERGRAVAGGAALAGAATVKLYPAVLGLYLLRRRSWRGVAAAIGTGLGLIAVGLVALGPETYEAFLSTALTSELQTGSLVDDPGSVGFATVRRQLAWLLPGIDPDLLPLVAALVLVPVVAILYRRVDTLTDRLVAVLGTLVATFLWLPTEPIYGPLLFAPLIVLLYLLERSVPRWLLLAGTVLTFVRITPGGAAPYVEALPADWPLVPLLTYLVPGVVRVILPATVGMWLILAAGVVYQVRGGGGTDGAGVDG